MTQKRPEAECDKIFDIVFDLANVAHDSGMVGVSDKLEDVLDALLEHKEERRKISSATAAKPALFVIPRDTVRRPERKAAPAGMISASMMQPLW